MEPKTGEVKALVGGRDYEKVHLIARHKQNANPAQRLSRFYIMSPSNTDLHHRRYCAARPRRLR